MTIIVYLTHSEQVEVLTAAGIKMDVFWVVAPCSLTEVYRRFRGAFCLHYPGPHDGDSNHL
jgi:hypothetical protein